MKKPRVFISHNRNDKPQAREIAGFLKAAGVEVFFDEWSISAGDSIVGRINSALEKTTHFVLIWSQNANTSNWVKNELASAISTAIEDRTMKIIPVCLPNHPNLPPLIRDLLRVDYEPNLDPATRGNDLVQKILGRKSKADMMKYISSLRSEIIKVSNNSTDDYGYDDIRHWGYNACPECGGQNFEARLVNYDYDEGSTVEGATIQCLDCDWSDEDITIG